MRKIVLLSPRTKKIQKVRMAETLLRHDITLPIQTTHTNNGFTDFLVQLAASKINQDSSIASLPFSNFAVP